MDSNKKPKRVGRATITAFGIVDWPANGKPAIAKSASAAVQQNQSSEDTDMSFYDQLLELIKKNAPDAAAATEQPAAKADEAAAAEQPAQKVLTQEDMDQIAVMVADAIAPLADRIAALEAAMTQEQDNNQDLQKSILALANQTKESFQAVEKSFDQIKGFRKKSQDLGGGQAPTQAKSKSVFAGSPIADIAKAYIANK